MKKFLIASFSVAFALFLVAAVRVPSQSWFRLAGNDVVVGHVVTATNADGSGHWAAPSGGSTNFSFLFVTNTGSISNIVIPSADGEWSFYNLLPGDNLVLTNTGSGAGFIFKQTQLFSIINDVEARDAFFRRNVGVGSLTVTNGQTNSGPLVVNDNVTAQNFVNPTWNDGFVLFSDGNTVTESTTLETALAVADLNTVTGALQPQLAGKVDELSGSVTNLTAYATNNTNLVLGWINNASFAYNTLTTSGANISSAIESASFGIAYTNFPAVSGSVYRISFTLTLNSGVAPLVILSADSSAANAQLSYRATSGTNRFYLKSSRTATEFINLVNDANGNWAMAGVELVLVTPAIRSATEIVDDGFVVLGSTLFKGGVSAMVNFSSEVFGQGASATTNQGATVFGYHATPGNENTYAGQLYGGKPTLFGYQAYGGGTAIGYAARATNFEAVAIGPQTYAGGLASIAIGDAARALGINEIVMGDVMWARGNAVYVLGGGAGSSSNYIAAFPALGGSVTYGSEIATAHNQGFLGWYDEAHQPFTNGAGAFNDWWIGGPQRARAPHAITLNITSLIGTDSNGVPFTINGSQGTGTGSGGNIVFATSPPGGAGSSLNARTDKLTLTASNLIAGGTISAHTNGIAFNGTNVISASGTLQQMGAHLFTDGTNFIAVFQDAAGARTTNKLTMSAWP